MSAFILYFKLPGGVYFKESLQVCAFCFIVFCMHVLLFFPLIFLSYKVAKLKREMDSVQVSALLTAACLEPC